MAILQAQHLLLFLMGSSLFFSLASCQTNFEYCDYITPKPNFKVDEVKISPDPVQLSGNGNITIVGSTPEGISGDVNVELHLWVGSSYVSTKTYSLCDITACPVAPGPFRLSFSNIFTPAETKKAVLYDVIVTITDKDWYDIMCIKFHCTLTGVSSLIRQITG